MWEPRRLTTLWASTACYRDSFTFTCKWKQSIFALIEGVGLTGVCRKLHIEEVHNPYCSSDIVKKGEVIPVLNELSITP
jgi:hypothetical protein